MKHLRMIGLAIAAAFYAGRPMPRSSRGTLKNIKETGAMSPWVFANLLFLSLISMKTRSRSGTRWTSATASSMR